MRIEVNVDSPEGIYFAGDKISGSVVVTLDQPQQLKLITVFLRGVAKIAFREGIVIPIFYDSNNVYFDQHSVINRELIVFANGRIPPVVEKGTYTFSFTFLLPNTLGSSFVSSHGHVSYWIEVAARKRFLTQRIRRNLQIFEFKENTLQISYRTLQYEAIIHPIFSCMLPTFLQGRHATARCHIQIPRLTFYTGEVIQITVALMDYHGEGRTAKIVTDLLQEFSFKGGTSNRRVVEPRRAVASQRSQSSRITHVLPVPLLPKTGDLYHRACVNYFIRIRAKMLCRKYALTVPVIINGPLNDLSRKWTSQYAHCISVSSEPPEAPPQTPATPSPELDPEELLRNQQQEEQADHLLRLLNFPTSEEEEDEDEIEEECEEAQQVEIKEKPDVFTTVIPASPSQQKEENSPEQNEEEQKP